MRIDLYTKTILTLIAFCLLVIACKTIICPNGVIAAAALRNVQFSTDEGQFWVFDSLTGDIWHYNPPRVIEHYKMIQPGQQLK
jgi:hypothetical protein